MLRTFVLVLGVLVLVSVVVSAQPVSTVYDLHLRYEGAQMIELVPGVEVPADMWRDDHVVTAGDLVAVGVSIDDAGAIVGYSETKGMAVPCTWSQLKWCIENNIPLAQCCGMAKENG